MKGILYLLLFQLIYPGINFAQQKEIFNYEESKVGSFKLPSPLVNLDGRSITTREEWAKTRRDEVLQLFKDHVYGEFPERLPDQFFEVLSVDSFAFNGKAILKQIRIYFNKKSSQSMDLLLYLPKYVQHPVPVFAGANFYGNQTTSSNENIYITDKWVRKMSNDRNHMIVNNRATALSRGYHSDRWQIESVIERGYGLATIYYGDLEPDHSKGWLSGIRSELESDLAIKPSDWSAIGAWAWGLCRMMDYLESDKTIDASKVILMGHSRLGKAALWAGANDQRFAAVISNNSGEGGAALARRWYGETINRINSNYPYWFSNNYKQYNYKPDLMPVDQHMLLSLIAPRPLYVASAVEDLWADPKGEFLSAVYAEEVYNLFDKEGLGVEDMPPIDHPVGETIHYHIRSGKHAITRYDWLQYLDFADKHIRK